MVCNAITSVPKPHTDLLCKTNKQKNNEIRKACRQIRQKTKQIHNFMEQKLITCVRRKIRCKYDAKITIPTETHWVWGICKWYWGNKWGVNEHLEETFALSAYKLYLGRLKRMILIYDIKTKQCFPTYIMIMQVNWWCHSNGLLPLFCWFCSWFQVSLNSLKCFHVFSGDVYFTVLIDSVTVWIDK